MTKIRLGLTVETAAGVRVPAPQSRMEWKPSVRRVVDQDVVIPAGFSVNIPASGAAVLEVAPTGPGWAWVVTEYATPSRVRYVLVPDTAETLDYATLTDVDPATLEPVGPPPVDAWSAELAALVGEIPVADDPTVAGLIGNPESASGSAVDAVVGSRLAGLSLDELPRRVVIGDDLTVPRPIWGGPVDWWTSLPGGTPMHAVDGDTVTEYTAVAPPAPPVFTDSFARADGPLGVTDTGGLAWATSGAAVWGVRSGRAQIVTAGANPAYAVVRTGSPRGVYQGTVAAQTSTFHAALCFRYVDDANCYVLARTSGSDFTTRLVKRVAGTAAGALVLTGHRIDAGTTIRIDDTTLGQLRIYFDDVLVYDEATATMKATEHATADGVGMYLGAGDAPLGAAAWDDLSYREA